MVAIIPWYEDRDKNTKVIAAVEPPIIYVSFYACNNKICLNSDSKIEAFDLSDRVIQDNS